MLEAGDVVIKLNGIVARKTDVQCQDEKGMRRRSEGGAEAADPCPRRRLSQGRGSIPINYPKLGIV